MSGVVKVFLQLLGGQHSSSDSGFDRQVCLHMSPYIGLRIKSFYDMIHVADITFCMGYNIGGKKTSGGIKRNTGRSLLDNMLLLC